MDNLESGQQDSDMFAQEAARHEERAVVTTKKVEEFSWIQQAVVDSMLEPDAETVLNGSRWITARWCSDLLKNEEYTPSVELCKSVIVNAVNSIRSRDDFDEENLFSVDPDLNSHERDPKIIEVTKKYEQTSRKLHKDYDSDTIVKREENHPIFNNGLNDFDDHDSLVSITREFAKRLSGTPEGVEVAEWMMDHIENFYMPVHIGEESTSLFYAMLDFAGKTNSANTDFYYKLVQFISSEVPETKNSANTAPEDDVYAGNENYVYQTGSGARITLDYYDRWDTMFALFNGRWEDIYSGVVIAIASMDNQETRNKALAQVFGEKGPAEVLNYIRRAINDNSFSYEHREDAARLFRSFYEGIIPKEKPYLVPADIEQFYDLVVNKEMYMTEQKEGDKREKFLVDLFEEAGIESQLVVDVACGTGWLTDRLANHGYNVIGIDINENLIDMARERFPQRKYDVVSWDEIKEAEEVKSAKVFLVNGRSIQHANQFLGVHQLMSQLGDAEMVVFDAIDPKTGSQFLRLENFRQTLRNFGFDEEWLEGYMWQGLGSHDGVTLGDRWYPPAEWWENIVGMYGFVVEKHIESDYDGSGVDNIVYVCKKVTDTELSDEVKARSRKYFRDLMDSQPKNTNGYKINNWDR